MTKLSKFADNIGGKISEKQSKIVGECIISQLPFLRVITDTKEILHISIGEKISLTQIKKICIWIKNNIQKYTIVLLTNFELTSAHLKKSDEHKQIVKIIETASLATPLLMLFQNICKFQKKKPEIVAYVNPENFNKT